MSETAKRPLETENPPKAEAATAPAEEPAAKKAKADEAPSSAAATAQAAAAAASAALQASDAAGGAQPPSRIPESLKPAVKAKLQWLFQTGKCREDEIDTKIMLSIAEFSDAVGVQILEHFAEADMNTVRNKSAFLAGVMRRFRNETR
eukprot:CAMPEP_0181292802 /NCGR_PEP_ID=MMETSP1101-20121128/2715_1 /TAXON_ID=46948 /ORGANISM="Rhodomonas abbreviata, Strain Caron Lab Isolate" /LENGTH=147 /DNA_ID=CAMNT_0023397325 /DNA_START=65 /DNA_END=505 /DNA_ORIENTATION=-